MQNPPNICFASPANYDVTLQVSDGFCTSTQSSPSYIHVIDCSVAPHASFISCDTVICGNMCVDFVSLSTNAQSWQWSFPGGMPSSSPMEQPSNVCYNAPGSYDVSLIVTNPAGIDTFTMTNFIQVGPGTPAPVVTQNGNTLTSTPAVQYQWYLNNVAISGATSQQHLAMLSGNYFVTITDAGGCTASSVPMHVSLVGIEEESPAISFSVYPNPFNDRLTITLSSDHSVTVVLKFFDSIGRQIFSEERRINGAGQVFDYSLPGFANGVYFLQCEAGGKRWTRPIIKN
jgi:PKD repeat protein